jgi:uncharacterized protein (TIGR02099 family)
LKNLLIALVVLWGLLVLAVRSTTPLITDYRDELGELLSAQLGVPVTIGELRARWYGAAPLLEMRGVTIGDGAESLEIDRVSLHLTLQELLGGSQLDALRLTVDGMQLTVVRETSGQMHLAGIEVIQPYPDRPRTVPPLPSSLRLINTRVVWIDHKAEKPPFTIDNIDIVFDREGTRLDLRARLETASGNADLSAKLDGFLTTRDWGGETYLKVDNLDVADLFEHYLPTHYGLHGLQLDLESWGQWEGAFPVGAQGEFQLRDLRLHPKTLDAVPLHLARAGASFSIHRRKNALRVGLSDLLLVFRDHQWPFGDLAFALTERADGGRKITAAADYLRIDDIARILQVRLPWQDLREPIQQLQPRGEIRNLRLAADITAEQTQWRAQGDFSGVTTAPWGQIPGVENLNGSLHGQQDHVVLHLDSRDAEVRFRDLFRDPLKLVELEGRLDILRENGRWKVLSDNLHAETPDIDTRTRLMLDYQPDRPLFLDLQTNFSDGDAANALRYYPTGIMDEDVVAWLDSSIRSGRVPAGTALVYGTLDDFPYEEPRSGTFQVVFDTRDLELDYLAGWPKLEHLDARVKFYGNQLDIDLESASIYDSQVADTHGHIDSLNPAGPLKVQGAVNGPLQSILRLLQEDALRDDFGDIVAPMRAEGDSELRLAFTVPLADEIGHALDGQLGFDGAQLSLPDWGFTMSDIQGQLDFNLDGLSARGIRARTLGAPVRVDVSPMNDGTTRIRTRGNLGLEDIMRQVPAIPLQAFSGRTDFVIEMNIPAASAAAGTPGTLSVESDLKGVRISLPAPFGKTPEQTRQLSVKLPVGGQPAPGSLQYAGLIDAKFSSDGHQVDVMVGGNEARLGPDPGVRIAGQLETVDLLEWGESLKGMSNGEDSGPTSLHLDLGIGRLKAGNLGIDDLHLDAGIRNGLWRGKIEAPNLAGSFSAAQGQTQRPIQVDLDRLSLQLPLGDENFAPPPVPDPEDGPDPATLPGLVINIVELRVNEADLGQLRLNAQHAPEGLHLTEFSLRGGQLELDSAGHWSRTGAEYATEWGGRASAADLGDLLVDLGYSRQVEQASSTLEFLLRWPGNPAQFHRISFAGNIRLDVNSGRIVELDPGVTRVVGLLNLNALTRRLRLDFSDIYKKGFSFDSIKGDFNFTHGIANTSNLRVLGPTGRIDLEGDADLVSRTLDQHVKVTPDLDATLPIASTLAGGPVAGLAVLVAQKVMNKGFDDLNRFEYSLIGPWAEPEVKQLDTGGTLSKILQPFSSNFEEASAQQDPGPKANAGPPEATKEARPAETRHAKAGAAPPPESEQSPEQNTGGQNPFRGLFKVLKDSKPHGADLPGAAE